MNEKRVNIVCVYWKGNFQGRIFLDSDVDMLRRSVEKHIDRPYRFYCLTNDMNANFNSEKIKLKHNWPGWWSKIELFRPDLPEGRTLYIDLDSHVVGNLGPLFDHKGDLILMKGSGKNVKRGKYVDYDKTGEIWQYRSGVMLFEARLFSWIYFQFEDEGDKLMRRYRGDQDLIADWLPNQPTFPPRYMVKLKSVINRNMFYKETKIVTGRFPASKGDFHCIPEWLEKKARG